MEYGSISDQELNGGIDWHSHKGTLENIEEAVAPNGFRKKTSAVFCDSNSDLKSLHQQTDDSNLTEYLIQQITAILIVVMLNFMIAIPFGVSYFPVGWQNFADGGSTTGGDDSIESDGNHLGVGEFPLPGKEALGIRMFLFSTMIGQFIFTFKSGFKNGVGLQMVENVPFCHALANICISEQGFGIETLSTIFFLFGLASFLVGAVFFILGYFEFGQIVYFFPNHVLVGCIGGIGFFVMKTGLEVTMNTDFPLTLQGLEKLVENINLIGVVLFFEITLRVLTRLTKKNGKPKYPLLSPLYYCAITPLFYLGLKLIGLSTEEAHNEGYFFPSLIDSTEVSTGSRCSDGFICSVFDHHLYDIFTIVDFNTINWTAVAKAIPTLVSLISFSLIHVPINIPAFSISSGVDADMNVELKAHGYSNALAGLFGGLQNYLCYANSVLYAQSNGEGIWSGLTITFLTVLLFFFGPSIAAYIPRCMAGTLLLHVGMDLFLEGVYDSYGKFDVLEYTGIWAITLVMSIYGMSAALVAGIIAALSVYAVQSITHQNPVRGAMCAKTLRSSRLNRPPGAKAILDDDKVGRKRIFVIQLQGHIFFGNAVLLTKSIKDFLRQKLANNDEAWIVILDFTLVLGIDSSAAHSISKLNQMMHRLNVSLAIFVTGSLDGFPCSFDLTNDLIKNTSTLIPSTSTDKEDPNIDEERELILKKNHIQHRYTRFPSSVTESGRTDVPKIPADNIFANMDEALTFAEDALIALQDHSLLSEDKQRSDSTSNVDKLTLKEEEEALFSFLRNLCEGEETKVIKRLQSHFKRNVWKQNDIIWQQSSSSESVHILVSGVLLSILEEEAGTTETVHAGAMFGELGLISGMDRLSTVNVQSTEAITMSIDKLVWEEKLKKDVDLSRCLYMISIRYMSHRLQHVSNRVFETRCLPI